MGYSGLIYAVIVAAWAGVLVPRWLRRHEEVDQARETDAMRGVRVVSRGTDDLQTSQRPLPHAERTLFRGASGDRSATGEPAAAASAANGKPDATTTSSLPKAPELATVPTFAECERTFAFAAQRRRRTLGVLVVALAFSSVSIVIVPIPMWVPGVIGGVLAVFLVTARRAAVAQSHRRRQLIRAASRPAEPAEPVEVEDGVRVAVLDESDRDEPADPDAWEPVDIPKPTYLSKPAAPRTIRTIDLTQPGSWTSGRLDPASSLELPPRSAPASAGESTAAEASSDDYNEHSEQRWAVGD